MTGEGAPMTYCHDHNVEAVECTHRDGGLAFEVCVWGLTSANGT